MSMEGVVTSVSISDPAKKQDEDEPLPPCALYGNGASCRPLHCFLCFYLADCPKTRYMQIFEKIFRPMQAKN